MEEMNKQKLESALVDYFNLPVRILKEESKINLERKLINKFRSLSHDKIKELVSFLENAKFFTINHNNVERRRKRRKEYLTNIYPFIKNLLCKTHIKNILDIGTGDGTIFSSILDYLKEHGQSVSPISGDIIDYCKPKLKRKIGYRYLDSTQLPFNNNFFDLTIDFVMLHHLPSKRDYKRALSEIARVTKPEGHCLIVETTHSNRFEHYINSILDIYLNNLTSIQEKKNKKNIIPIPINFLSEQELKKEFDKLDLKIIEEGEMFKTENDPKRHKMYLLKKISSDSFRSPDILNYELMEKIRK